MHQFLAKIVQHPQMQQILVVVGTSAGRTDATAAPTFVPSATPVATPMRTHRPRNKMLAGSTCRGLR